MLQSKKLELIKSYQHFETCLIDYVFELYKGQKDCWPNNHLPIYRNLQSIKKLINKL